MLFGGSQTYHASSPCLIDIPFYVNEDGEFLLIVRDDTVTTWSKSNYIFVKKSAKEFFLGRTFIAWVNHMHYILRLHFFAKQRKICWCEIKDLKIYCEQNTSLD